MGLLASVERYSQGNYWQHVTAEGLRVKIQHVKKCFTGETLPAPTAKVIAAWNDLPNAMLDIPPKSTKTGFVFLRVLTPTPTGLAFDSPDSSWEFIGGTDARVSDTVAFPSHDSSWTSVDRTDAPTADAVAYPSRDCHDSTRELSLDNTDTPASDVVASQGRVLKGSTALDSSRSLCSHPDQSSDRRNAGEDSVQSTNRNVPSPPSNNKSYSSGGCAPWTSAAFHNMVNQWFAYYRALKTEAFVKSLVAFGVKSLENALLASRVARVIIKKVVRESDTEGRILGKAIRSATLESLREYWESNDNDTYCGINMASFIGSLFDAKISIARDVHYCLSFLLEGEKRIERLYAMHALLVQANDKLCKNRNLQALMHFRDGITSRYGESGEYVWATRPGSEMILNEILATIERWKASQAIRREQPRTFSKKCNISSKARVGPRLHHDPAL